MIQVTSREFRDKQASMLDLADKGEQVIIRRRGHRAYMLVPVNESDFIASPNLEQRLNEGRKEFNEGKTISCSNAKEAIKFLESL